MNGDPYLSMEAGVELLAGRGVAGSLAELAALVELVRGEGLALKLLAAYLHEAHQGAAAGFCPAELGEIAPGGEVAAVLGAFERLLAASPGGSGEQAAAHGRVFDQLQEACEDQPATLEGLLPLYQAIRHGCQAGRYHQALHQVYIGRILRGSHLHGFFSTRQLGAASAELAALAAFFVRPFSEVTDQLPEEDRVFLCNQAGFYLSAIGRPRAALEPTRVGLGAAAAAGDWNNAAGIAGNLAELHLLLGNVGAALDVSETAVELADRSEDLFRRLTCRAIWAEVFHRGGNLADALALFKEAEALQTEWQSHLPMLYSVAGCRFCDVLLIPAERTAAAWGRFSSAEYEACGEAERRLELMFSWLSDEDSLLDRGLVHLGRGRLRLFQAILSGHPELAAEWAGADLEQAVALLEASGHRDFEAGGLLARAWLRAVGGDGDGAWSDLDAAHTIAFEGEMALYLTDIALYRGRLFAIPAALREARERIEHYGFFRRLAELGDAEAALAGRA